MSSTAVLVPGSFEPEPDPADLARGVEDLEDFVNSRPRVQEVGRGVTSIVEAGFTRAVGRIGSAYLMPRKLGDIVEISPGVYRLN